MRWTREARVRIDEWKNCNFAPSSSILLTLRAKRFSTKWRAVPRAKKKKKEKENHSFFHSMRIRFSFRRCAFGFVAMRYLLSRTYHSYYIKRKHDIPNVAFDSRGNWINRSTDAPWQWTSNDTRNIKRWRKIKKGETSSISKKKKKKRKLNQTGPIVRR